MLPIISSSCVTYNIPSVLMLLKPIILGGLVERDHLSHSFAVCKQIGLNLTSSALNISHKILASTSKEKPELDL